MTKSTIIAFVVYAAGAGIVRAEFGDWWCIAYAFGVPAALFAGAWIFDMARFKPPPDNHAK